MLQTYDKRGVGASQGQCCPGDYGHFNLLAADADGALHTLATRRDIDPDRLGFIGASQAGMRSCGCSGRTVSLSRCAAPMLAGGNSSPIRSSRRGIQPVASAVPSSSSPAPLGARRVAGFRLGSTSAHPARW
jgi:hypothetical protein